MDSADGPNVLPEEGREEWPLPDTSESYAQCNVLPIILIGRDFAVKTYSISDCRDVVRVDNVLLRQSWPCYS